jgi:hypothetical protein
MSCTPGVSVIVGARTELIETENQDGLIDLEAEQLGLHEAERLSVDLNEALASLDISSV